MKNKKRESVVRKQTGNIKLLADDGLLSYVSGGGSCACNNGSHCSNVTRLGCEQFCQNKGGIKSFS